MIESKNILLSTAYLPPVQWFSKLVANGFVYIEHWESYHKQTYRNRCMIDSPNGAISLTVPVEKPSDGSRLIKDMRISDHDDWRTKHWHALESSYYNSPFFEFYQDDFRPFYEKKYDFLIDFNQELVMKCLELMNIEAEMIPTSAFMDPDEIDSDKWADLRDVISPKTSLEDDPDFRIKPYYQVFDQGAGFKPNLSIIDLIFNMGPESVFLIKN